MTDYLNIVTKAAKNGKSMIVVFFDMTKSSDRVSHRKLRMDIKSYDVPRNCWLAFYLIWTLECSECEWISIQTPSDYYWGYLG